MIDRYQITVQQIEERPYLSTLDGLVLDPPPMEPWETAELLECEQYGVGVRCVWAVRSAAGPTGRETGVGPAERERHELHGRPGQDDNDGSFTNSFFESMEEAARRGDAATSLRLENDELRERIAHLVAERHGWEEGEVPDVGLVGLALKEGAEGEGEGEE